MSCVPSVASVSGLSILVCPKVFSNVNFKMKSKMKNDCMIVVRNLTVTVTSPIMDKIDCLLSGV